MIAILLCLPLLVGSVCSAACGGAEGVTDRGDAVASVAGSGCCGEQGNSPEPQDRDGGCESGCSACCQVQADVPRVPVLGDGLTEAEGPAAGASQTDHQRHLSVPLRPPRLLS